MNLKPPQAQRAYDLVLYALQKANLDKDKDAAYALRILDTKARHANARAPKLAKRKAIRKILRTVGEKPKTKSDWLRDADMWFSRFIRLRDAKGQPGARCITCNAWHHITKLDCGHWIRRENWGTRYNEKNAHSQCKNCNYRKGGAEHEYEKAIAFEYGPSVPSELRTLAKIRKRRLSAVELEEIAKCYEAKVSALGGWGIE